MAAGISKEEGGERLEEVQAEQQDPLARGSFTLPWRAW